MGLMSYITEMRKNYLRNQVEKIKLPDFEMSPIVRKKFIFAGKVQKVGFRVETYEMAKRLGLSGHVKNNPDNSVEAEVQGEEKRIDFLIKYLKSIKRISIDDLKIEDKNLLEDELDFMVIE